MPLNRVQNLVQRRRRRRYLDSRPPPDGPGGPSEAYLGAIHIELSITDHWPPAWRALMHEYGAKAVDQMRPFGLKQATEELAERRRALMAAKLSRQ